MKRFTSGALFSALLLASTAGHAGTIDSAGNYRGTVRSVAPGFFAGVGVELDGVTCNGWSVVILPHSDTRYKDILAVLLSAQATGQNVRMPGMLGVLTTFGSGSYSFCTITAASVGDFPLW
jgi:hypothetical protein